MSVLYLLITGFDIEMIYFPLLLMVDQEVVNVEMNYNDIMPQSIKLSTGGYDIRWRGMIQMIWRDSVYDSDEPAHLEINMIENRVYC